MLGNYAKPSFLSYRVKNVSIPTQRTLYFEIDVTLKNSTPLEDETTSNLTAILLKDLDNSSAPFGEYIDALKQPLSDSAQDVSDLITDTPE